jgi:hypothetical protein
MKCPWASFNPTFGSKHIIKEHGVFTGKQSRQAALRAANKGKGTKSKPEIIHLRERGKKKMHVFKA